MANMGSAWGSILEGLVKKSTIHKVSRMLLKSCPSSFHTHENRSKLYLNSVQVIIITLLDLRRLVLEHNLKQMNWI